jgi:hypothetical protein
MIMRITSSNEKKYDCILLKLVLLPHAAAAAAAPGCATLHALTWRTPSSNIILVTESG